MEGIEVDWRGGCDVESGGGPAIAAGALGDDLTPGLAAVQRAEAPRAVVGCIADLRVRGRDSEIDNGSRSSVEIFDPRALHVCRGLAGPLAIDGSPVKPAVRSFRNSGPPLGTRFRKSDVRGLGMMCGASDREEAGRAGQNVVRRAPGLAPVAADCQT